MPAPISASGTATRSTGRRRRDPSPVSSNRLDWPARSPAKSRIVVPEFAQSIGSPGSRRPRRPTPSTRTVSTSSSCTVTPSARSAAMVASVSPDRPKWRMSGSPSPTPPVIRARGAVDLSPGTATWPSSAAAGFAARLAVPAREEPGAPGGDRALQLLHAPPVLAERLAERTRVLEEDVDPDPRVRAGDAGHVAQRPARRRERLVALDAARAGLVDEHVRQRVRQGAPDPDQAGRRPRGRR